MKIIKDAIETDNTEEGMEGGVVEQEFRKIRNY